jgi:hypothetical protein
MPVAEEPERGADGARLIHIEPLYPGPGEEDLFGCHASSFATLLESARLPANMLALNSEGMNRAVAEGALAYHRNRMRAVIDAATGRRSEQAEQPSTFTEAKPWQRHKRT